MSPAREPDSRVLRRYGRDLAEKEQRRESEVTAGSGRGRRGGSDEAALHGLAGWNEEELERIPPRAKHGRRRVDEVRRRVGRATTEADLAPGTEAGPVGSVVATSRGPCEVELEGGERVSAHLPKALAREDRSALAVGDLVELVVRPSGDLAVARRLPRTSRLSRPDPFDPRRERVLAANLDLGVVVASVRQPQLSTGLLDRFLVALEHGGVAAAIAVNKIDLADRAALRAAHELLVPYRELGVPLALCSVKTGEGVAGVRSWISGRTVAFVGHSGVGKSSLLNALAPESGAVVGEVSARHGKGRHTTTGARVYRLPDGTRIVDTPGVREFGLWRLAPRELAVYFEEFDAFAVDCRFRDCTHVHEPGCAVRAAAERSAVSPQRFATYLRILSSFERE